MNRRIGRFYVDDWHLADENMVHVFSGMVPLHTEHLYHLGRTLYVCRSDRFREVPPHEVIPLYDVTITLTEDSDTPTVTFEEVTDPSKVEAMRWSLP